MSQKILIIAPAWVGDLVMSDALFRLLKERDPSIILHVLAAPTFEPLLRRMPEVDAVIISHFGHGTLALQKRYQFAKTLRTENYAQAIVLPNSFKSALIPYWAKIPLRTGWRGEMRYFLLNDLRLLYPYIHPLMVQRFVALGLKSGELMPENYPLPKLKPESNLITETLQRFNLVKAERKILALCPGAEFGISKRWPLEYFAAVAKAKAALGWNIWIFGGTKDREIAAEIQKYCADVCVDLTGKTSLGEAVDLLSLVDRIVTNDTGLMHVAAALDKPLVAIFGSSSPHFTPPLTNNATILTSNLDCSPCFRRDCPLGHLKCLREITPEQVLALL